MGREHDPIAGQWYENLEDGEAFLVLSVDEDSEMIEVQYEDGDIEELDYETWQELDLEKTEEPEGWTGSDDEYDDEDDWDEDDEDEDDQDDEDEDDDEDDWDDDDDDDDRYGRRDDY